VGKSAPQVFGKNQHTCGAVLGVFAAIRRQRFTFWLAQYIE
jgi:hypothetical protein